MVTPSFIHSFHLENRVGTPFLHIKPWPQPVTFNAYPWLWPHNTNPRVSLYYKRPSEQHFHALADYPENEELQCDTAGKVVIGPANGADYSYGMPPGTLDVSNPDGIQFDLVSVNIYIKKATPPLLRGRRHPNRCPLVARSRRPYLRPYMLTPVRCSDVTTSLLFQPMWWRHCSFKTGDCWWMVGREWV